MHNLDTKTQFLELRAVELEALQEKILASHEAELSRLARRLQALEQELDKREDDLKYEATRDLYHLAALGPGPNSQNPPGYRHFPRSRGQSGGGLGRIPS